MVNEYYNFGRLKGIIANLKESINDMEKALKAYDTLNDSGFEDIIANGIRMSFVQIREEVFSAVSSILKSSGISVNKFSNNMDIINECRKNGVFTKTDNSFFIILNKYRNSACNRYKQPSVEDIKNFYENKKINIEFIIEDLEKIINATKTDNNIMR